MTAPDPTNPPDVWWSPSWGLLQEVKIAAGVFYTHDRNPLEALREVPSDAVRLVPERPTTPEWVVVNPPTGLMAGLRAELVDELRGERHQLRAMRAAIEAFAHDLPGIHEGLVVRGLSWRQIGRELAQQLAKVLDAAGGATEDPIETSIEAAFGEIEELRRQRDTAEAEIAHLDQLASTLLVERDELRAQRAAALALVDDLLRPWNTGRPAHPGRPAVEAELISVETIQVWNERRRVLGETTNAD